jgi:hypothetical protein
LSFSREGNAVTDNSKKGFSLKQAATIVGLIVGALTIWRAVGPFVFPPQLEIEISPGFLQVVDAATGEPIEGARIYVEPLDGSGPLRDVSGNAAMWRTNSQGIAAPLVIPNWQPVPTPSGPIYELDFIAVKDNYKSTRKYWVILVGQSFGSELPRK